MPSNLLWIRSSFMFFLFKYDAIIIKQPSSCSFGKKNCKILEHFEKIKNHLNLVPSRIWENVSRLGELDNVEYVYVFLKYY